MISNPHLLAGEALGATQLISGCLLGKGWARRAGPLLGETLVNVNLDDVNAVRELLAATNSVRRVRKARKLLSRALLSSTFVPNVTLTK